MQTFLPHADYAESARVLDRHRLGNQCYRECKTLINGGWPNHPASRMWRGHEHHLALYALALAEEMGRRGRWKTAVVKRWIAFWQDRANEHEDTGPPPWLGDEAFHRSHRSNLLRKNPDHYRQFWPDERDDLPYIWPG